jgi:hypothetical protein
MRFVDLTGNRYGKLIVVKREGTTKHGNTVWECICDCGKIVTRNGNGLTNGRTVSCGCNKAEKLTKHNMSHTRIYQIWTDMKSRCNNPKHKEYNRYGGRGIKVCSDWMNFENFYNDMNIGYSDELTIERSNVNGDYEKVNCRWATLLEQGNNRRNTFFVTVNGVKKSIEEWSRETGTNSNTIRNRLEYGWDAEKAVGLQINESII